MFETRKQVMFDLDDEKLEMYYPNEDSYKAYLDIREHMTENGFVLGPDCISLYISQNPLSHEQTEEVIKSFIAKHPWINLCVKGCKVTDLGEEHSIMDNVDNQESKKAWEIAEGLIKADGLETSAEFKELRDKEIRGEITTETMRKILLKKYSKEDDGQ